MRCERPNAMCDGAANAVIQNYAVRQRNAAAYYMVNDRSLPLDCRPTKPREEKRVGGPKDPGQ